jgi:hypothetical protein
MKETYRVKLVFYGENPCEKHFFKMLHRRADGFTIHMCHDCNTIRLLELKKKK